MNDLVPFEYETFKVREAVWPDPRSVRFPRAEVGRIFGARQKRPEALIDGIIRRHPHLKDLGIAVAVTAILRGRTYQTLVYSLTEIHQLAVYSQLPQARRFLEMYPALHEAEILGRFMRVAPKDARERAAIERLDGLISLPARSRRAIVGRKEMAAAFSRSRSTIRRWERRRAAGDIPPLRKQRSDKGRFRKFSADLMARAAKILKHNPKVTTCELIHMLGSQVGYSTLRRWRSVVQETV